MEKGCSVVAFAANSPSSVGASFVEVGFLLLLRPSIDLMVDCVCMNFVIGSRCFVMWPGYVNDIFGQFHNLEVDQLHGCLLGEEDAGNLKWRLWNIKGHTGHPSANISSLYVDAYCDLEVLKKKKKKKNRTQMEPELASIYNWTKKWEVSEMTPFGLFIYFLDFKDNFI